MRDTNFTAHIQMLSALTEQKQNMKTKDCSLAVSHWTLLEKWTVLLQHGLTGCYILMLENALLCQPAHKHTQAFYIKGRAYIYIYIMAYCDRKFNITV